MALQTMDVDAEASWIRARLEQSVDPSYEPGMRRTVPSALQAYAVRVPEIRRIAAAWRRANRDAPAEDVIALADVLWNSGWREEMIVGLVLVHRSKAASQLLDWPTVERWSQGLENWEHVDHFADVITAPLLLAQPERIDAIERLASSDNPWQRRLAIVTLLLAARKDATWLPRLDAMATRLTGDKGPTLRKAVAWARKVQRETEAKIAR